MKILYLGHYKENSGWGLACRNMIEAMATVADLDVTAKAIRVSNDSPELSNAIKECELKSIRGNKFDVVIQNVLPYHMEYSNNFDINIGYSLYEAFGNYTSGWKDKLSLMDKIWTSSKFSSKCIQSSDFRNTGTPIDIVPLAYDVDKFKKQYEKIDHPALDGNFIFYTVADLNKRKNLTTLVKAFHLAFPNNMPVSLVLKVTKSGLDPIKTREIVENMCNEIKTGLKLYGNIQKYHGEILITNKLDDDALMSVHNTGHCFVSTSYGEAWSLPLFEAMGIGNSCIYPDTKSFPSYDFIQDNIGWPIKTKEVPVFGEVESIRELYTGYETWYEPDVQDLVNTMRFVYNNYNERKLIEMRKRGTEKAKEYSFESVGKIIRDKLCS